MKSIKKNILLIFFAFFAMPVFFAPAPAQAASYVNSVADAAFSGWSPDGRIEDSANSGFLSVAAANGSQGAEVVANTASNIIHQERDANDIWVGSGPLTGVMKGTASIAMQGGDVNLAIRGGDNALWVNRRISGVWSDWVSWGGGMSGNPAAIVANGILIVGIRGLDGTVWVKEGATGQWKMLPGLVTNGDVSAAGDGSEVFLTGRDNAGVTYMITRSADGNWGQWEKVGGTAISDPAIIVKNSTIYIAVVGQDNSLWYASRAVGATDWQWAGISGQISGRPVLSANEKGILAAARGSDGRVWFRFLDISTNVWSDWTYVPTGQFGAFSAVAEQDRFTFFVLDTTDKAVWYLSYYTNPTITSADFIYKDYSIADLASGGKELTLYVANAGYKAKLIYQVDPSGTYITKRVGLAVNDGSSEPVNHANAAHLPAYITASGSTFKIGNASIERTIMVKNGAIETTQIYNKISQRSIPVQSDEFAFRIIKTGQPAFLDLERMSLTQAGTWNGNEGNPIFFNDIFMWVKHPYFVPQASGTGSSQFIAERMFPQTRLANNYQFTQYESVLGVSAAGQAKAAFQKYFENFKQPKDQFRFTYETWWTVAYRVTETEILRLINTLDSKLFVPFGIKFDTFRINDSWTNLNSIWKADPQNFPNGFGAIAAKLANLGVKFGLWMSPSSMYPSQDKSWAKANGYVVSTGSVPNKLCLLDEPGKSSYYQETKNVFADYINRYGLSSLMLDGFLPCYPDGANEGDNLASLYNSWRGLNPNIELEATYGPWSAGSAAISDWLLTTDIDYPSGILPALNYKEAYLTTRAQSLIDGMNFTSVPAKFLFPFGIMVQTDDPWKNDGVANMLTGSENVPIWIDPAYFTDSDWSFLAGLMGWARMNQKTLLGNTTIIGGQSKNGEVYGFSHFNAQNREAYVYLRNPVIDEKDFTLNLDATSGFTASDQYSAKIIYPYRYVYDGVYPFGGSLKIHLKGFESLVLHIKPQASMANDLVGSRYELASLAGKQVLRVWGQSGTSNDLKSINGQTIKADFCNASSTFKITSSTLNNNSNGIGGSFNIQSTSNYANQLVVLIDSPNAFNTAGISNYTFSIDGSSVAPVIKTSDTTSNKTARTDSQQWTQVSPPDKTNYYWKYFIVDITTGNHSMSFRVSGLPAGVMSSANILATESLVSQDIDLPAMAADSDDRLPANGADKLVSTIGVGQNVDWSHSCAAICTPKTCSALNFGCGSQSDGCGGTLDCGTCASGKTCSAGVCVVTGSGGGGSSGGGGGGSAATTTTITTVANTGNPSSGGGGTSLTHEASASAKASADKPANQSKMTRVDILAAIAKIQALISDLQKQLAALGGGKATFSCAQITKNLFYGMTNDSQVKCLQEVLRGQGFPVAATGNYGAVTKSAVAQFQQKYAGEILAPYHLTRGSGNVGNATLKKINQIINSK